MNIILSLVCKRKSNLHIDKNVQIQEEKQRREINYLQKCLRLAFEPYLFFSHMTNSSSSEGGFSVLSANGRNVTDAFYRELLYFKERFPLKDMKYISCVYVPEFLAPVSCMYSTYIQYVASKFPQFPDKIKLLPLNFIRIRYTTNDYVSYSM